MYTLKKVNKKSLEPRNISSSAKTRVEKYVYSAAKQNYPKVRLNPTIKCYLYNKTFL